MADNRWAASCEIDAPAEFTFDWHEQPSAFERLVPPWEPVQLARRTGSIHDGDVTELLVGHWPLKLKWIARHEHYDRPREFVDVQDAGPFSYWRHSHGVAPLESGRSRLTDSIEFRLPLGWLGRMAGTALVRRKLHRMFEWRHHITRHDVAALWQAVQQVQSTETSTMRILISGAGGLVGSELVPFLQGGGHEVAALSRSSRTGGLETITWDPAGGQLDVAALEGFDAVVHLAGENIAGGRWNEARKQRIRDSRVQGTRLLAESLAACENPPKVLACASAIGYYGDRGDEVLNEDSSPGEGFLPEVCREWEEAADAARDRGIRVVNLRLGVVLSPRGGALQQMLTPFNLGGGGVVGSGKQYWSWVALDDVVGAIHHALTTDSLSGPVNTTAPAPATNREFTKTLGKVLQRPTIVPLPAFAARLVLGEMADDLLLASARVMPERLVESGYQFRCPDLEGALRHLLGR